LRIGNNAACNQGFESCNAGEISTQTPASYRRLIGVEYRVSEDQFELPWSLTRQVNCHNRCQWL